MNQRVKIVFEEKGPKDDKGDQPFIVYIEGGRPDFLKLPEDQRSAAEFWGARMFSYVAHIMGQTGIVRTVEQKPKGN